MRSVTFIFVCATLALKSARVLGNSERCSPSICETVYNESKRIARIPLVFENGSTPMCSNATCAADTCCETEVEITKTCDSFDANRCTTELGPTYCKYSDAQYRVCADGDTCTSNDCCYDCVTRISEFSMHTSSMILKSVSESKRCARVSKSLGTFQSAEICATAAKTNEGCVGSFAYAENSIGLGCFCCGSAGDDLSVSSSDSNNESIWSAAVWNVYTYHNTQFCDVSSPPANGSSGTCDASLRVNSTCTPICDAGYRLSSPTTCQGESVTSNAPLSDVRVRAGSCFQHFDAVTSLSALCEDTSLQSGPMGQVMYAISVDDFVGCGNDTDSATCADLLQFAELELIPLTIDPLLTLTLLSATVHATHAVDCTFESSNGDVSSSNFVFNASIPTYVDVSSVLKDALGTRSDSDSGPLLIRVTHDQAPSLTFANQSTVRVVFDESAADIADCVRSWKEADVDVSASSPDYLETCHRILDCRLVSCSELDLSDLNLRALPSRAFANVSTVRVIDLTGNAFVEALDPSSFAGASAVEDIIVDDAGIRTLLPFQFTHLDSLRRVSLRNTISPGSFALTTFSDAWRREGGLPGSVEVIDLSGAGLSSLPPDVFVSINETLVYLQLEGNSIAMWSATSVGGGLGTVEELDLTGNALSELTRDSFDGMIALRTLILTDNSIRDISADAFWGCCDRLTTIWLGGNQIVSMSTGVFASSATQMLGLKDLTLNSNKISILRSRAFAMPSLETLNLVDNSIREIEADVFAGVSLDILDLSGQGIATIHDNAFRNASIRRLKLTRNNVLHLSAAAFAERGSDSLAFTIESPVCENFVDWTVPIGTQTFLTCDEFAALSTHVQGVYMGTAGTSERSPAEACCDFRNGGWERGLSLIMDAHSTITCFADGAIGNRTTSFGCACGDAERRFDVDAYTCVQSCSAGDRWMPASDAESSRLGFSSDVTVGRCARCDPGTFGDAFLSSWPTACVECSEGTFSDVSGSTECRGCASNFFASVGSSVCTECPSGRSSSARSGSCDACSWQYAGSEHCEIMVTGITLIVFCVLLAMGVAVLAYDRCRKQAQKAEKFHGMLDGAKKMLETAHDNLELMSSAWIFEWSEISLKKKLASGAAGQVWSGTLRNKWSVAIKKIYFSDEINLTDDAEIKFLQRVRHKRLVLFLGCGRSDDGNVFTVIELMSGGSFDTILWGRDPEKVSWANRLQILSDSAEGMTFLHMVVGSVHRDLKSPNILLGEEKGRIRGKVADFGLSRFVNARTRALAADAARKKSEFVAKTPRSNDNDGEGISTKSSGTMEDNDIDDDLVTLTSDGSRHFASSMTGNQGTIAWMAPEIMGCEEDGEGTKKEYSQAVDTYAFAIIMWEALSFSCPWTSTDPADIRIGVPQGKRPTIKAENAREAPPGFVDLMRECWAQDPNKRPVFTEIGRRLNDLRIIAHRQEKPSNDDEVTKIDVRLVGASSEISLAVK